VPACAGALDSSTRETVIGLLQQLPAMPSESERAWALRRRLDALATLLATAAATSNGGRSGRLVDFADEAAVRTWQSVNDVVMGGRSSGYMAYEDTGQGQGGVFQGVVTSEGGGGFSSVRSANLLLDCAGSSGPLHASRLDTSRNKHKIYTVGFALVLQVHSLLLANLSCC
jgi:hypothetical protein